MLISLDWLKEYVEIKENIKELENTLTMIGQEVEAIEEQGKGLENVVIGQIVDYKPHPEAEKLTLLRVKVADDEELQIVCGAPNHQLGDKVVVAKIGAVLPGDFKIKKSKIRGIESCGMLCSKAELGLGTDGDGIIILPESAPIGLEYREYRELNDVIFELEITPNRPDCLSYVGIAREIAAYYDREIKMPKFTAKKVVEASDSDRMRIEVQDKNICKRYSGKIIKNLKIGESPEWLKKRLLSVGVKPINNVVDATNYILFETNQPLHAYDISTIQDGTIFVRKAVSGEKVVTLDGIEKELKNGELVIADTGKILGIAGVIGGESSKVTEKTIAIFLECAYFTPSDIRKTSKRLGVSTDSSYRFERGVDIENIGDVLDRACKLISEIADGEIVDLTIDERFEKNEKIEIKLDLDRFKRFVGKEIPKDTIIKILTNLGIEIVRLDEKTIVTVPPSYRGDLTREADLYEEIIRMYGFENIESRMPQENIKSGNRDEMSVVIDEAKRVLSKIGLQEVINYSFVPREANEILKLKGNTIKILNPISDEMAVMRSTLIYGLLMNIRDNLNRNQNGLKIFEAARVYIPSENGIADETLRVAIGLVGRDTKTLWEPKPETMDFYDLKGYVEKFLEQFGISKYQIERSSNLAFHPGRAVDIKVGKFVVGSFGEIHPDVAESMDIKKERAYVAELDITALLKYRVKKVKYEKVIKYPEVTRDLAIVLDRDILVGDMVNDIKRLSALIETVEIFDIYQGDRIEKDKKSVAISFVMRKKDGTLEENEVKEVVDKVLEMVAKNYNGVIRQ